MSEPAYSEPGTFRDPAGYLVFTSDGVTRVVRPAYESVTREFLGSALRQKWEAQGALVATEILPGDGALRLRHPAIAFPTYPWEWTTGQWRAAADLTLRMAEEAVAAGWTLKDATPLNILFEGTRPVMVDVLSFERRDPRSPVWLAYAQFVRTFLLPLMALRRLHWPLSATANRRDGYEPKDLYEALGTLQRFSPKLLWPVTLPAIMEKRETKRDANAKSMEGVAATQKARAMQRDAEVVTPVLLRMIRGLRKRIDDVSGSEQSSLWAKYEQTAVHYTGEQAEQKKKFVQKALERAKPGWVLDVGANTGTYSLLAAASGARVVALEGDTNAAEVLWKRVTAEKADVLPVVADIAWPTPAYGWANKETRSLLDRAHRHFDLVLMLAVVHHLLLHNQIPLDRIAHLFSGITREWLLLEWVPPTDPMFQKLMRGRDELYGSLSEVNCRTAFEKHFGLIEREQLSNGRVMLLYRLNSSE
jgi:SAM-dependent methyltransferase